MLDMKQAAEQVLFLAEKKKLKDVDIVVERNESLDPGNSGWESGKS